MDSGSSMTSLIFVLILFITPSLWPLIWPFVIVFVFGFGVFTSSPDLGKSVSRPELTPHSITQQNINPKDSN